MQMISEVMTRNVEFVSPQENVQRAAQMMNDLNVGALPVCEGDRLVGMVTDRDITIRATAAGKRPSEAHVDEVMSRDVRWCFEDQPLDDVMIQMADSQIRRVPVVSHDDQHRLIGIVALGDLATKTPEGAQKQDVEEVVKMVSSPAHPVLPEQVAAGKAAQDAEVTGTSATSGSAGLPIPNAGEHGIGAAGASGETDGSRPGDRSGQTDDTRRNFGVSGQDLTRDGLPPH
jgi:CBS domain-containing protein